MLIGPASFLPAQLVQSLVIQPANRLPSQPVDANPYFRDFLRHQPLAIA